MAEHDANVSKISVTQLKGVPISKRKISLHEASFSNVQAVKRKSVSHYKITIITLVYHSVEKQEI